ncbi:MAG: hypothetical protein ABW250_20105 [Pyrinomonadaceae bacterium]
MNKIFQVTVAVAAFILAAAPQIDAQEQEKERQPVQEVFQTEMVYPQERGEVQVTFSPTFARGGDRRLFQSPLTIEYGLTDKWQVEVEWQAATFRRQADDGETARGSGDLRLGTKYSLMNVRGSDFHTAVGLEVGLPVGNVEKGLGEGFIEYEPYLVLARDLPRLNRAQVFAQVGVGLLQRVKRPRAEDEDEPAAHEFNLNAGVFVPVRRLVVTGEISWQTNRWNHGGDESHLYVTPGVVWHPFGAWEVGVGVPVGLTGGADKFRNVLKLTYEF